MKYKIAALIFFIAFYSPQSMAYEETLVWKDCVALTRKYHPDLVSAREKIRQAESSRTITSSSLLPQVSSSFTAVTSEGSDETYAYNVSGRQLVFDGFKTIYNTKNALENINAEGFNYSVTSSNVRLRLRAAFVNLLGAQELVNIAEKIARRRKQNAELVELRYKAGREHRGSFLTADAQLAEAEFEVTESVRKVRTEQKKLIKELGKEDISKVVVKGNLSLKSGALRSPDIKNLVEINPLLRKLAAEKQAAKFAVESAKSDFYPEVHANAKYGKTDSSFLPRDDEWSVGMSVSLPVFEGGRRIAELSRKRSFFDQAQADEQSGRDGIIVTLEENWTALKNASEKVGVRKKFLEAARERAKIAEAQYSTGLLSFNEWIIIENELASTQKAFLTAEINALVAEAKWIQAKGGTLEHEK